MSPTRQVNAELPSGLQLGPYVIDSFIGAGGMGQVYRAEDERLHRPVAVKILPAAFASNAERMRRFEQEARLAGSLSHPNIMIVHDVGRHEDRPFIVEELLEGDTLRDRMRGRFYSPQRAVEIGRQIADGLAAAHAKGIVHRDLKPSNIFISQDGSVKILDFGLAKLRDPQTLDGEPDTGSTTDGILGTVGYLSPEQARGNHADHRTDIFGLGCVLYEMLTGRKAFPGASIAEVLAATLTKDPPSLSRTTADVPSSLARIVHRCLEKEPEDRFSSAHDLSIALEATRDHLAPPRWWHRPIYFSRRARRSATVGLVGVSLAVAAVSLLRTSTPSRVPEFTPRQLTSGLGLETDPAVSPDGLFVAYVAAEDGNTDIWLTGVEGGPLLRLTRHPGRDRDPAWFPDGLALAFVSDRGGEEAIWKVSRLGGPATLLLPQGRDPAISPDGTRVAFTLPGARGAERIAVAQLRGPSEVRVLTGDDDGRFDHRRPAWSPDGRTICYQDPSSLWLVGSDGGDPRRLTVEDEAEMEPSWSSDGRHVYYSSYRDDIRALWRRPLAGGEPQRVTMGTVEEGRPTFSADGRWLAYATESRQDVLVAIDTSTGRRETFEEARTLCCPSVAPDGSEVVFASDRDAEIDLWRLPLGEAALEGKPERVTDLGDSLAVPRFSPDGRWIAFFRKVEGQLEIWTTSAAGGPIHRVTRNPADDFAPAWAPDGTQLGFVSLRSGARRIWAVPMENGVPAGEPYTVLADSEAVVQFAWSPDGRQVAYVAPFEEAQELWVGTVGEAGSPHPLTEGANPFAVRWLSTGRILLLASWDTDTLEMRVVDPETGETGPLPHGTASGSFTEIRFFDTSADGRWIVFVEDERQGDIWLLEATEGSF